MSEACHLLQTSCTSLFSHIVPVLLGQPPPALFWVTRVTRVEVEAHVPCVEVAATLPMTMVALLTHSPCVGC
jgi:hypothetical protein